MKYRRRSFVILFVLFGLATPRCSSEEITLSINLEEPIAVTDEKFLSLTIDPVTLLAGNALSTNFERSINLARALSPAYLRFGGPRNSLYYFTDSNSQDTDDERKIVLSESDWVLTHQWAEKAGLDVIACISPENRQKKFGESENAREIVSFNDHMDFNANWQLGYGKQTVGLRKVLDEYPRYSRSIVTGPDVVAYNSVKYQEYLRDYLGVAAPALSAITWHPDFDSVTLGNGGAFVHQDNLEEQKEEMLKVIGRFIESKPLWIAESSPEECKSSFIGALVLTRRLGNAAKLNAKVFMRQPTDLARPTPDYWVSLLHKTLVEREVFDARIQTSNENHIYLYCQCAKASNRHKRGSIVIFGVNLSPEDVAINFEGAEITAVHEYVLSPGLDAPNRMFAKTIFLNDKLLTLTNNTIPEIRPKVLNDAKGVDLQLQSGDISFWVVPDLKIKSCMRSEETSRAKPSRNYKSVEKVKIHVKRSVRRAAATNEKMNRISDYGSTFKSNIKRELKRLKRFVKRKLDDYESRSLLNVRGLSGERTGDVSAQPEENMQSKLQEFKKRLGRLRGLLASSDTRIELRKPIADLVTDAIALTTKIQNTLKSVKKQTGQENRKRSSDSVRESLNTLYERLARGNLDEPIDSEGRGTDRESKRTRRDLLAEIGSTDLERDGHLRGAAGNGRDRNTFRELFEANLPGEDFSEDDAFHEHSPLNRGYDYVFVENSPLHRDYSGNDELKIRRKLSRMDYEVANDRPWAGRESIYDYHFHEPADLAESLTPSRKNDRLGNEKEPKLAGTRSKEDHKVQGDNGGSRGASDYHESSDLPRNHRPIYGPLIEPDASVLRYVLTGRPSNERKNYYARKKSPPDYHPSSIKKEPGFPIGSDYRGNQRSKRKDEDLQATFDEEMINEDDANSRDCKCRVVRNSKSCRSKRDAVESLESLEHEVDQIPVAGQLSKDIVKSNVREDTDVEVFSEFSRHPFEKELRAESPSKGINRESSSEPLKSAEASLEDSNEDVLDRSDVEEFSVPPRSTPAENWELQDESSNVEIARNEKTTPWSSQMETSVENNREIPTLQSRSDFETLLADPKSSTLDLKAPDESAFFLGGPDEKRGQEEAINTAKHTGFNRESSTPAVVVGEEKGDAGEVGTPRAESSSTTVEAVSSLSEGTIGQESENNYDNGSVVGANSKREAKLRVAQLPREKAEVAGPPAPSKRRLNVSKPRASKAVETLRALKDLFLKLKEETRGSTSAAKWRSRLNTRRNEARQIEQLRKKLRDKRQMILQSFERGIRGVTDGTEQDPEGRKLKRREAWERIRESEDFRDMIDREKLAYALMYQPARYCSKREVGSSEVEAPEVTEIVRARNVRRRVFNPSDRRNFRDREHLDPGKLRKIIQLANLHRGEKSSRGKSEERKGNSDKVYLAVVEDIERPRIFYYEEDPESEEEKGDAQALPPRSLYGSKYSRPLQQPYRESLKAAQYSEEEDQEESDELPEGREIYIIDPSEYKGGDPPMQLYGTPSKSGINLKKIISRKPGSSYESRETSQPARKHDESSPDAIAEEIVKTIFGDVDSRVEELFKMSARLDGEEDESFQEEDTDEREENGENCETEKTDAQGVRCLRESDRDVSEGETQTGEDDYVSEALISRENATDAGISAEDSKGEDAARVRERRDADIGSKEYLTRKVSDASRKSESELDKNKKRSGDASYGDENVSNMQELRNEKQDKDNKEANLKEAPLSDISETLRVLPWIRKLNRLRREAMNRETNENKAEKVQPSELQHLDLDGSSSPRSLISSQIDDVEKSLIQKIPLEKFSTSGRNANKRKNIKRNNDDGLSSLLQRSIPKLGNVVVNGLNKAENFTGSVERLIMNLDEKYNKTLKEEQRRDSASTGSIGSTQNVLHNAVANIKKIFILLSGITNLLQGNQE
ncbi:Heparanase [Melipona quadrifasciata]|uniref:Heparanase n=1 Tax=Melipona quadrifasciata TaxID=166423 RepID=A0A0M8ZYS1_9HYME|nr:Heparanase [Melipona quadrifasciata]